LVTPDPDMHVVTFMQLGPFKNIGGQSELPPLLYLKDESVH
jgi:hypothetical protein